MTAYVCTKCGGGQVQANRARPSIDDRFAIGWCKDCDKERTLARDDNRTRRQLAERDQAAKDRRLVARVRRGDVPAGERGEAMVAEAAAIKRRWAERLHGGAKEGS